MLRTNSRQISYSGLICNSDSENAHLTESCLQKALGANDFSILRRHFDCVIAVRLILVIPKIFGLQLEVVSFNQLLINLNHPRGIYHKEKKGLNEREKGIFLLGQHILHNLDVNNTGRSGRDQNKMNNSKNTINTYI